MKLTLPTNSEERKNVPLLSGLLNYFPAALAGVARISKAGNDKHNPGQPLHHARGKSMDHGDCIIRHTMDLEDIKAQMYRGPYPPTEGEKAQLLEEARCRAWRALAELQELEEKHGDAPLAPGAKLSEEGVRQVLVEMRPYPNPIVSGVHGGAHGQACGKQYYSVVGAEDRNCTRPYGHKGDCG